MKVFQMIWPMVISDSTRGSWRTGPSRKSTPSMMGRWEPMALTSTGSTTDPWMWSGCLPWYETWIFQLCPERKKYVTMGMSEFQALVALLASLYGCSAFVSLCGFYAGLSWPLCACKPALLCIVSLTGFVWQAFMARQQSSVQPLFHMQALMAIHASGLIVAKSYSSLTGCHLACLP